MDCLYELAQMRSKFHKKFCLLTSIKHDHVKGGRLALSVKSWPHNCEAGVRSPSPVVPLSKEPNTQLMGQCCCRPQWPKIATALCAITCCITLLYRVRMPAPHYTLYAVIHASWLRAFPQQTKHANSEGNLHTQEEECRAYCKRHFCLQMYDFTNQQRKWLSN